MKTPALLPLLTLPLLLHTVSAQEALSPSATTAASDGVPARAQPTVRASSTAILPDGRQLIMQRIDPPILVPAQTPAAAPVTFISPEARAARRAEWAAKAPLATYILPVMATVYPGGITHLSWRHQMLSGEWKEMQAWSRTDFSSLNVVSDIEVARVRYWIFASVIDGTLRTAGKRAVPAAESLPADGSFVLMNGDVTETAALAPIQALHEHYRQHGPALDAAWSERLQFAAEEAERKRSAPPPGPLVIQFWDLPDKPIPDNRPAALPATPTGAAK